MASGRRRRVGRTVRRPRRRSASTRSIVGAGPLQAIGENTVVDRTADDAMDVNGSSSHLGLSPTNQAARASPKKQSKKRDTREKDKKKRKRPQKSALICPEKKRAHQLDTLLDELETQVQEHCDELVADAERRAQELEVELKMQLLIMPAAVRQMPWKTFVDDFGGDLHNAIHSLSQSQLSSSPHTSSSKARDDIVAATPCSVEDPAERYEVEDDGSDCNSRNCRLSMYTTPLDRRRVKTVPSTVLRPAREGEFIYSAKGSPIVPDTVAKAPAGSLVATFEEGLEPTACLRLDSERVVDLSRPEELSAESRGEATFKLKALQAKVAQLLRQINPCAS
uniref:Borealin N-terminal domain-containing protein n=1 Tax=Peronospora matthiolae TaxID=2874970 RepID=A0AAV1TU73_9STRA